MFIHRSWLSTQPVRGSTLLSMAWTRDRRGGCEGDAPVTVMGLSSPVAVMASPPVSRIARTVYPTPALQNTQTRGLWHTDTRRIYTILPLVAGPGEGEGEGEGREWRGGARRGKARVRGCAPALGLGELHHERGVLGRHLGEKRRIFMRRNFARLRLRSRRCTLACDCDSAPLRRVKPGRHLLELRRRGRTQCARERRRPRVGHPLPRVACATRERPQSSRVTALLHF